MVYLEKKKNLTQAEHYGVHAARVDENETTK